MDINVIEGKDVELVCDAFGKPDPIIKWFAKNEYFISSKYFFLILNFKIFMLLKFGFYFLIFFKLKNKFANLNFLPY